MNEIILGRGCTYEIAPLRIVIRDPDERMIAALLFTNVEACSRAVTALGACLDESLADLMRVDPDEPLAEFAW